jgi:hypothetical protein
MKLWIHGAFISINFRLLQGLALGGEYGGAQPMWPSMPVGQRGYWTLDSDYCNGGFIHLFNGNSCTRNILTPEQFDEWGWRVPFWLSIVMVGVFDSKNMDESPVFAKAKSEGKTSTNL